MGAGQFGAGAGGAGMDPVYLAVPPAPFTGPRAVKYDPSIKQYVLTDANGNKIDVHPVDQIVVTRLTVEQGSSASSPTLGQRIRKLWNRSQPARYQQIAQAECTRVLQDLINAGDVKLLSVSVTFDPVNGARVVVPTYVNMRSPLTNPRFPDQNAQSLAI
jgi:hypothetical protein